MNTQPKSRFSRQGARLATVLLTLAASPVRSQSPWAATQGPGPVGRSGVILNGMATARGSSTAAWFEWGLDST
jgi:hypothetical protein